MHFYLFCKDNDTFSVRVHYDILEKWKGIGTIDIISLKKKTSAIPFQLYL